MNEEAAGSPFIWQRVRVVGNVSGNQSADLPWARTRTCRPDFRLGCVDLSAVVVEGLGSVPVVLTSPASLDHFESSWPSCASKSLVYTIAFRLLSLQRCPSSDCCATTTRAFRDPSVVLSARPYVQERSALPSVAQIESNCAAFHARHSSRSDKAHPIS